MLALQSIVAEISQTDGAVSLNHAGPFEEPPWVCQDENTTPEQPRRPKPSREFWVKMDRPKRSRIASKVSSQPVLNPVVRALFAGYRKLATGRNAHEAEIRLLNLLPGELQDSISCEIWYTPLSAHPPYEALSYCWGSPDPAGEICCDGQPVQVTPNLSEALRALRYESAARLLWVDAICINQSDNGEKSHQVPLMGMIYREASAVQIWLGNDTPDRTIETAFQILTNLRNFCVRFGWNVSILELAKRKMLEMYGLPDVDAESWTTIRDLLESSWFSRTWIIQEVLLSQQAFLQCGKTSMPWINFCIGMLCFSHGFAAMRRDTMPSMSAYIQVMQLVLSYHQIGPGCSILDLPAILENHRIARATDPRDKIFGFLGVYELSTGRPYSFVANYLGSPKDIFIHAAKEFLTKSPTLDILGIPRVQSKYQIADLPSWVPDWNAYDIASSLNQRSVHGHYKFQFDTSNTTHYPKVVRIKGSTLELEGHCFDKITRTGDVLDPRLWQDNAGNLRITAVEAAVHCLAVLMNWFIVSGALSRREYPTGEDIFDVVIRTLFLDHFGDRQTLGKMATYYRRIFVPLYALRSTPENANLTRFSKFTFFWWSVLGRILGPRVLKAIAKVAGKWDRNMYSRTYVQLGPIRQRSRNEDMDEHLTPFTRSMYRTMITTERGYISLAPRMSQPGDSIFFVKGSRVPLILRPSLSGWELIGDCYVHGIMHGEAFNAAQCEILIIL